MISLNSQPAKTSRIVKTDSGLTTRSASKIGSNYRSCRNLEETREQLRAFSDRELLGDLQKINQKERRLKVLVLLYLSEIDRRQLCVPLGYSSL